MADHQDPQAGLLLVGPDHGHQVGLRRRVEHRRHLVAQEVGGFADEGTPDTGPLQLALAHHGARAVEQVGGEPHPVGHGGDQQVRRGPSAPGPQGLGDDVAEGQSGVDGCARALEHQSDPGAEIGRGPVAGAGHDRAVHGDVAGGWALEQRQHPDQAGLPAPAGAEHPQRLAAANLEVETFEHAPPVVGDPDAVGRQARHEATRWWQATHASPTWASAGTTPQPPTTSRQRGAKAHPAGRSVSVGGMPGTATKARSGRQSSRPAA